jgi:hypothetical protein
MAFVSSTSSHHSSIGRAALLTQPDAQRDVNCTLVRLLWMNEYLTRKPVLRLSDCQERWGVSLRTFRRDLARLRDAGFIIDPAAETCMADPAVCKVGWHAAG